MATGDQGGRYPTKIISHAKNESMRRSELLLARFDVNSDRMIHPGKTGGAEGVCYRVIFSEMRGDGVYHVPPCR